MQGPGGYWAKPCVELGNSSGQRFPIPCRPSSSHLCTSHYSAQGPETSGVILEVQPHHHGLHGDCLSPQLHTNCHGHSVARPTASAVGHMKVRAIVSPTQAWGCVTWQEEMPPPCYSLSPAPSPASPFRCALLRARRDGVWGPETRGTAALRGEEAEILSSCSDRNSSQ